MSENKWRVHPLDRPCAEKSNFIEFSAALEEFYLESHIVDKLKQLYLQNRDI